ncbi:STAS domain-containing protein [Nocardioides humilatus]|uniref:Anti-sigma factor antagonist n=1 Tax=Nocardioides humilatus TaxID=2607660 RepID=A0A5B1LB66_9ACTN|nr:STAS domain-containing protein [Nocardioides humilatus]KAA1416917.1 STAS domain-containing protein [Nocardioides humilatus]
MQQVRSTPTATRTRFNVRIDAPDGGWSILSVAGDLDLSAALGLQTFLATQEDAGRTTLRLDLSEVTFMDCSCLRVLSDAHVRLSARGGGLEIFEASRSVSRLLRATGLLRLLKIGDTR